MFSVQIKDISKAYPETLTPKNILSHYVFKKRGKEVIKNLNINFKKGEVVGIIGENGAGKSTLLKMIAGITRPSQGKILINGSILAILEIATGLQPEWTGRENINELSKLYNIDRTDFHKQTEKIIEFSGLGSAIDNPVRTYSSGMTARLAFSLVTSSDNDIFLIDEALSVGDAGFVTKSRERLHQLIKKGKTSIIVSHSLNSIKELCTRAIWMHNGDIIEDGNPIEVVEKYKLTLLKKEEERILNSFAYKREYEKLKNKTDNLNITEMCCQDKKENKIHVIPLGNDLIIKASVINNSTSSFYIANITFIRSDGIILASNSKKIYLKNKNSTIKISYNNCLFGRQVYESKLTLKSISGQKITQRSNIFSIYDIKESYNPLYHNKVDWKCINDV